MYKPTVNQLNYAKTLSEQLGMEDQYDWLEVSTSWTKDEVSDLIDYFLSLRERR